MAMCSRSQTKKSMVRLSISSSSAGTSSSRVCGGVC